MTEWQPIETAPRDGREVLVYDGTLAVASWQGIIEWQARDGTIWPSYWMPLPNPPEAAQHKR